MKLAGKSEIEIGRERERERATSHKNPRRERDRHWRKTETEGKNGKNEPKTHTRGRDSWGTSWCSQFEPSILGNWRFDSDLDFSWLTRCVSLLLLLSSSFSPFLPFFSSISSFTFFLPLSASCHYRCPFYPTDRRCVFHRRLGRFVRARVFDESVKLPLPENREKVDEHAKQHNLVWTSSIRTLERVSERARGASNVYLGVCCLLSGRIYQRAI